VVRYIGTKFNEHLGALAKGKPIGLRDLYTGNFSARRETLIDVGLFDEAFTMYGNEDVELGVRLTAAGVRLVYVPDAIAEQRYTKPFPALARDNEAKGRTAVQLARKHPQTLPALKLSERGSRRRRVVRAGMLGLTRLWTGFPAACMKAFEALERLTPRIAQRAYPGVLDYFYWRGANAELRRPDGAGLNPR
jgi:GT2 family glycosyltransferase